MCSLACSHTNTRGADAYLSAYFFFSLHHSQRPHSYFPEDKVKDAGVDLYSTAQMSLGSDKSNEYCSILPLVEVGREVLRHVLKKDILPVLMFVILI